MGPAVDARDDARAFLRAVTRFHQASPFGVRPPEGLCPLVDRVSLFAPWRVEAEMASGSGNPLPAAVVRGWERFVEVVAPDVAGESWRARPSRRG